MAKKDKEPDKRTELDELLKESKELVAKIKVLIAKYEKLAGGK